MLNTEKFTLFEFSSDPSTPARGMWVLQAGHGEALDTGFYRASEEDLEEVLVEDLELDGETTSLETLNIRTFDKVFAESLRPAVGDTAPVGLEAAKEALLKAAKDLTGMGLDVVVGFKTLEQDDLPPITMRAGR